MYQKAYCKDLVDDNTKCEKTHKAGMRRIAQDIKRINAAKDATALETVLVAVVGSFNKNVEDTRRRAALDLEALIVAKLDEWVLASQAWYTADVEAIVKSPEEKSCSASILSSVKSRLDFLTVMTAKHLPFVKADWRTLSHTLTSATPKLADCATRTEIGPFLLALKGSTLATAEERSNALATLAAAVKNNTPEKLQEHSEHAKRILHEIAETFQKKGMPDIMHVLPVMESLRDFLLPAVKDGSKGWGTLISKVKAVDAAAQSLRDYHEIEAELRKTTKRKEAESALKALLGNVLTVETCGPGAKSFTEVNKAAKNVRTQLDSEVNQLRTAHIDRFKSAKVELCGTEPGAPTLAAAMESAAKWSVSLTPDSTVIHLIDASQGIAVPRCVPELFEQGVWKLDGIVKEFTSVGSALRMKEINVVLKEMKDDVDLGFKLALEAKLVVLIIKYAKPSAKSELKRLTNLERGRAPKEVLDKVCPTLDEMQKLIDEERALPRDSE